MKALIRSLELLAITAFSTCLFASATQAAEDDLQAEWVIWIEPLSGSEQSAFFDDVRLRPESAYLLVGDLRLRSRESYYPDFIPWRDLSVQPLDRFSGWLAQQIQNYDITTLHLAAELEPTFETLTSAPNRGDDDRSLLRNLAIDLQEVRSQLDTDAKDFSLGTVSFVLRTRDEVGEEPFFLFLNWSEDGENYSNEAYFGAPRPGLEPVSHAEAPPTKFERYPTIEAPGTVTPGSEFAVQVSLTEELVTPESGTEPKVFELPRRELWPIDVVLTGKDFEFRDGSNSGTILLYKHEDSTSTRFFLTPRSDGSEDRKLYASFYYHNRFLFRVARDISVRDRAGVANFSIPKESRDRATLDFARSAPDLTVEIVAGKMLIGGPHMQRIQIDYEPPQGLADFLRQKFAVLAKVSGRGLQPEDERSARDTARGVGRNLYTKFAPPAFKNAFWYLRDKLGDEFQSIQIYSDNPLLPWELMIPTRGSEEAEPLGVGFYVSRWHARQDSAIVSSPLNRLQVDEIVVVAPQYKPPLNAVEVEARNIESFARGKFDRIRGDKRTVRSVIYKLPNGILHFAGHGTIKHDDVSGTIYSLVLENDEQLTLDEWRGVMRRNPYRQSFVFLNACDVGTSQRVVNFVEGWAPAMLDAGASAYLSAQWPVSDTQAAEFARVFYQSLDHQLQSGSASVMQALAQAKSLFNSTGNPTFLAYIYYGDPDLELNWPRSLQDDGNPRD